MNDALKNLLQQFIPDNLVEKFKASLQEHGIEIEPVPGYQHFPASKGNRKIFLLAHESTKDGWWSVNEDFMTTIENSVTNPELHLSGWGVVLLDGDPRRGYWINGESLRELIQIMDLQLDSQRKFHFRAGTLDRYPNLAPRPWTISQFIQLSGLNS